MDLTMLVAYLAPLAPYLVKGCEAMPESVRKEIGLPVWARASTIWQVISPRAASPCALQEVLGDLEKDPSNQAARGALVRCLDKLFTRDPMLQASVERLWQEGGKQALQTVIAFGNRSVPSGRDISGSAVTGSVSGENERFGRP